MNSEEYDMEMDLYIKSMDDLDNMGIDVFCHDFDDVRCMLEQIKCTGILTK